MLSKLEASRSVGDPLAQHMLVQKMNVLTGYGGASEIHVECFLGRKNPAVARLTVHCRF